MRRALARLGPIAVVLLALPATGQARQPVPVPLTFVGDSVPASLNYDPAARKLLARGLAVHYDLAVCRRLVVPSCPHHGSRPATALQVVRRRGVRLGRALLVDVGYNDDGRGYGAGIDRIMRAARRSGARGVVFVTLRETRPWYRSINAQIRKAKRRHPDLLIADWHWHSRGRDWFAGDGLHLTHEGARALARFLRPFAVRAAHLPPATYGG